MKAALLVTAAALGLLVPGGSHAQTPDPAEVVAAERAFAARVLEAGVGAGFSEFLAPEGVIFRPGPVNGRDYFADRPASSGVLAWRPAEVAISAAGDLGYSTGPYHVRPAAAAPVAGTGWYLSVWRRQPDGRLALVADHGLAARTPADTAETLRLWPVAAAVNGPSADLAALDVAGLAQVHPDLRTYAAGALHLGAAARSSLFGGVAPALAPAGGGVALSGDLAYTFGAYAWGSEQGHYLRVWRREGAGWQAVAEVFSPAR